MQNISTIQLLIAVALGASQAQQPKPTVGPPRFRIIIPNGALNTRSDGRLFVILRPHKPNATKADAPRFSIGAVGNSAPPLLAQDVHDVASGSTMFIDSLAAAYPIARMDNIPVGNYDMQAVLHTQRDINIPNAPGNLFSPVLNRMFDPRKPDTFDLPLTLRIPPEDFTPPHELVRFIRIKSERLSKFHNRPIYLRAGIILPMSFYTQKEKKYPLWIHIGGFGSRFDGVRATWKDPSFQNLWFSKERFEMIYVQLDGAGPFGDPYHVNSANNGPWGDATVRELIPTIEKRFRGLGEPHGRFTEGGSTGGWVSLALQVFYPDEFNGCWSISPDPVDFRAMQLVNIYTEKNAFINQFGVERASKRLINGETEYTMRQDVGHENILGVGDSYLQSGDQWGSWNAVFSPRLVTGEPAALFDPKTGDINPQVAKAWTRFDLRQFVMSNWERIRGKLNKKIHISVGDADDYFLNNAVRLWDEAIRAREPNFVMDIRYAPQKGHVWSAWTREELMKGMKERFETGLELSGSP